MEVNSTALVSEEESGPTQLWNQCLGHMNGKGLQVSMNCKLLPNLKSLNFMFCKHCIYGKQCRQKFKVGSHVSKGVLDYVHSDLWGTSPTISWGGARYYVLFVDDFSRKVWIYVLKRNLLMCLICLNSLKLWLKKELIGQESV